MPQFQDHFAFASPNYATYRPRYPADLFVWLARATPDRRRAWDCGTGSGQAAVALAPFFDQVIATDPSTRQLASAEQAPGVAYVGMTAEHAALADQSVGALTVAQALHWFNLPSFFEEANRVLVPGGVLAAWSYGHLRIAPRIDEIVTRFYSETVGPYWPPERAMVEDGYRGIHFPFAEVDVPSFEMSASWTLPQLAGYLSTWSAVGRYKDAHGEDPVPSLVREVAPVWGDPTRQYMVRWPLVVRAGRVA
jgi:SAM-dependent methyltransferase